MAPSPKMSAEDMADAPIPATETIAAVLAEEDGTLVTKNLRC